MSGPRFSVVIPAYNRADSIGAAMSSVLDQTLHDLELIVVDDGSTDATAEVARRFDDPRVRVIGQRNSGVSTARNVGVEHASGGMIIFLDSDDEADPDWLESLDEAIRRAGAHAVVCGARRIASDGTCELVLPHPQGSAFGDLPGPFTAGTVAMPTRVFAQLEGFVPGLAYSENTELMLRFSRLAERHRWTVASVDRPLMTWHVRDDRSYDEQRYEAARYLLDHHRDRLARQRRLLASYHAIRGVNARRFGTAAESRRSLARAVRLDPRPRQVARLLRSLVMRGQATPAPPEPPRPPPLHQPSGVRHHGLLVVGTSTSDLESALATLGRLTPPPASLTVVDTAPLERTRRVVREAASPSCPTRYLPCPGDPGPAGGLARGLRAIGAAEPHTDRVLLLGDGGTVPIEDQLRRLLVIASAAGDRLGMAGLTGVRLEHRTGGDHAQPGPHEVAPVEVDVLPGSTLRVVSLAAALAGPPDEALYQGLEDVDMSLRIAGAGFRVIAAALGARPRTDGRGFGDLTPSRPPRPWQTYYLVRNRVVVLRRWVGRGVALRASLRLTWSLVVLGAPRSRRVAGMALLGLIDGWLGNLGRTVDPR